MHSLGRMPKVCTRSHHWVRACIRVSVSTPVHAPDAVMGIEIAGDQTVSGLDFALEPGRLLEGTVTHVDGAVPIPDALVVLMPAEFAPHSARTDIAGAFAFRSLAAGTYHMTVMAPGVCTHQQMVTIPESGPTPSVNVALTHGSKVHGHVWLPDGASPLSEVYVVLLGSDGAQVGGAKSGTSGFTKSPRCRREATKSRCGVRPWGSRPPQLK